MFHYPILHLKIITSLCLCFSLLVSFFQYHVLTNSSSYLLLHSIFSFSLICSFVTSQMSFQSLSLHYLLIFYQHFLQILSFYYLAILCLPIYLSSIYHFHYQGNFDKSFHLPLHHRYLFLLYLILNQIFSIHLIQYYKQTYDTLHYPTHSCYLFHIAYLNLYTLLQILSSISYQPKEHAFRMFSKTLDHHSYYY